MNFFVIIFWGDKQIGMKKFMGNIVMKKYNCDKTKKKNFCQNLNIQIGINKETQTVTKLKTLQESQNAGQRTSHRLSKCPNVLTKRLF